MVEVSTVAALGLPLPAGQMKGAAGWPSYDAGAKDGIGAMHPVWGVQAPAVGGYVQLLTFLCAEELARLRVWYQPLVHADALQATVMVRMPVISIPQNLKSSLIMDFAWALQEHAATSLWSTHCAVLWPFLCYSSSIWTYDDAGFGSPPVAICMLRNRCLGHQMTASFVTSLSIHVAVL